MGFHLRSEWSDDVRQLQPAGLHVGTAVVHHTVATWRPGQDKAIWLRGLEHSVTDHVASGNSTSLTAIDYNELIFPDGDVWEGRGLAHEDAATYHFNGESASWALIGNYDVTAVPDVMVYALARRVRVASSLSYLAEHPLVTGHGDVGTFATACPGRFAKARLVEVRGWVANGVPDDAVIAPPKKKVFMQLIHCPELHGDTWYLANGFDARPMSSYQEAEDNANTFGFAVERGPTNKIKPKYLTPDHWAKYTIHSK